MQTPNGHLEFPIFLPDATRGVVRTVDSVDLETVGIEALVMNAYHLMQTPGSSTIKALGGLHRMTGWPHPILTDSGGFQIYSLIRQNPKYGSITDNGAVFRPSGDKKFNLTPEKSIQLQFSYGADIMVCLDDCTHVEDDAAAQRASVQRTLKWAARCKAEFERNVSQRHLDAQARPLLFGVVQGGGDFDLRRECAEALLALEFDGFGYGGWPLDADNNLLVDMLGFVRELIPPEYPLHALGVGHPPSIVACVEMGYQIFDSAMPTRDARNGRLYAFLSDDPAAIWNDPHEWFTYVYPNDKKQIKRDAPISEHCGCPVCQRYTLGYLYHLFKIGDDLHRRLYTLHNLYFMADLMRKLRQTQQRTQGS